MTWADAYARAGLTPADVRLWRVVDQVAALPARPANWVGEWSEALEQAAAWLGGVPRVPAGLEALPGDVRAVLRGQVREVVAAAVVLGELLDAGARAYQADGRRPWRRG